MTVTLQVTVTCVAPQEEDVRMDVTSTDRAIDRLIYELSHKGMIYGLTEDEIGIVEGVR